MPEITKKGTLTPSRPPGKARRVKKEGPILQVKNLRKVYEVEDDRVVALRKVSLSIQREKSAVSSGRRVRANRPF